MPRFDESRRLEALRRYEVLDTAPEAVFDEIVAAAATLCGVPISAVSLVDAERQWFKAIVGLDARETPRDVSFCAYAMLEQDVFVVPDARADPLFAGNALVTGDPNIRFYAGAPIRTPDGLPLGALCVIDTEVRPQGLTPQQAQVLRVLANQVEAQLKLRRAVRDLELVANRQAAALAAGEDREERLTDALQSAEIGWWTWDIPEDRVVANAELARLYGIAEEIAVAGLPVAEFMVNVHPADHAYLRGAIDDALKFGEPFREEYRLVQPDGGVRWVSARGRVLMDEVGKPQRFPGVAIDITERKQTETSLRDANLGRELAMQAAELGRFDHNLAKGTRLYDHRALDMMGLEAGQVGTPDEVMQRVVHPDDRDGLAKVLAAAVDPNRAGLLRHTFRITHARTGEQRWILVLGRSQFNDGVCTRFMGVFEDVTVEKRSEEHRRLLTNELNHRVKNTLAVVVSIVDQTLKRSADLDTGRREVASRIQALGRAHDILTADSWSGAPVAEIVAETIRSLSLPAARLEISGGPIKLGPTPALQLALALHELGANALKYGALSNDTGRVTLAWGIEGIGAEAQFTFSWSERGGPTVQPPARRGFGSVLIEKATASAFRGAVELDYRPVGVRWRLAAPLAGLAESGRPEEDLPTL